MTVGGGKYGRQVIGARAAGMFGSLKPIEYLSQSRHHTNAGVWTSQGRDRYKGYRTSSRGSRE